MDNNKSKEEILLDEIKELCIDVVFVDGGHHKQKIITEILKKVCTEQEYKELKIEDEGIWF